MRRLCWFVLGFAAACAAGAYGDPGLLALLLAAAASLLAGIFASFGRRPMARLAVVCLGLSLGLCWFCLFDGVLLQPARLADGSTRPITMTASDYPEQTSSGLRLEGRISLSGRTYRALLYLSDPATPIQPGDHVTVTAQLRLSTHGGQQVPTYHRSQGIFLLAYGQSDAVVTQGSAGLRELPTRFRRAVSARLHQTQPEDVQALAAALVLGDNSGLTYGQQTELSLSGIRHMTAMSGMHVSILFSLIFLLTLRHRILSTVLGLPVIWLFAAMAGLTPSVVRAAVMLSMMLLARLSRREYDSPTALAFAVLVLLIVNPLCISSASFQLSVGAVTGILILYPSLLDAVVRRLAGRRSLLSRLILRLARPLCLTLSATATTAPLSALLFGSVSLIAPVTNLLTFWAMPLAFCTTALSCLLPVCSVLSAPLLRYLLAVSHLLGNLPGSAAYLQSPYLAAFFWFATALLGLFLLGKRRYKPLFAGVLAVSLLCACLLEPLEPTDDYRVTVLDVGQGQCILLECAGRVFVVDCGGNAGEAVGEQAAQALLRRGICRIDGLILTHFDLDHISGASHLLQRIPTQALYLPLQWQEQRCQVLARQMQGRVYFVQESLQLSFGPGQLRIFPPPRSAQALQPGLSVLFSAGSFRGLITGDMDAVLERWLLRRYSLPPVKLLVAGHHGSATSTCQQLLQAVQPEIVVFSVDRNHGHPAGAVLERVQALGCRIFRTDQDGTLCFRGSL